MGREQERPLSAQLPISASVFGRYYIVVRGDVGIDRLMTDFENAPDAAADGHSPAIIVISLPVGGDEGGRGQVPALGEVIVEEGLQRHGIHVSPVPLASKGPDVKDQEASRYVQRPVRQEDDKVGSGRPFFRPEQLIRRSWKLNTGPTPHTKLACGPSWIGLLGEKKNSVVRPPRPNSVSPIAGPKISSAAASSLPDKKGG
jgi:hypothetical protein